MTALVGVIVVKKIEDISLLLETKKEELSLIKVIELRLDFCDKINITTLTKQIEKITYPFIFTVRRKSHGGFYQGTEEERLKLIEALADLRPSYIDIEYDVNVTWLTDFKNRYPNINIILSYHNFEETPENLDGILNKMISLSSNHNQKNYYKIAAFANSTIDALRMLCFVQKHSHKTGTEAVSITGISMGDLGHSTRILAPVVGSSFSYVPLSEFSAPGQISLKELHEIYHFSKLSSQTQIYALLGDPVDHSIGHLFHNKQFSERSWNAVYLKWRLSPHELETAAPLLKALPIFGFSVTRPLKEFIINHLDACDSDVSDIKAANSIIVSDKKWIGFNTDGLGALSALNIDIKKKTILILGAGGAARAIIYEALKQGAFILVINRTLKRAEDLIQGIPNTRAYCFKDLEQINSLNHDILINTLPPEASFPITENLFTHKGIVMSILYTEQELEFKKHAKGSGCLYLDGFGMYKHQALLQLERWSSQRIAS